MASFNLYTPTTTITKAMFNFDATGGTNYTYNDVIRVAVSDSFSVADFSNGHFFSELYTNGAAEVIWTEPMLTGVQGTLDIIQQFVKVDLRWQGDIDTLGDQTVVNPADVAAADKADINIALVSRSDTGWSGISGGNTDDTFEYPGGAGDVFIDSYYFGTGINFDLGSPSRTTLMHELLHSLGLSHPHSDYNNGIPIITDDFAATRTLGFDKLGFRTATPTDMYKEFFTIMSYEDQSGTGEPHTPMILDVIALQQAYGEGSGTQGAGNDTIEIGTSGYRVYFDKGGTDTIDLKAYTGGAYLHMGTTIVGASHWVGVAMSAADGAKLHLVGGDPQNLRWFYGEFENASGSAGADRIVGNSLANHITALGAADRIYGNAGNDVLDGGAGADTVAGGAGNDRLIGAAGDDILNGGAGNDRMSGGSGKDIFVFDKTALGGIDQIFDFRQADDTIDLDNAVFSKLVKTGSLSADNYRESSTGAARDGNDFILYNTHTGALLYDADANGAGHARQFATLWDNVSTHPTASELAPLDFVII